jgi:hypothetical protein
MMNCDTGVDWSHMAISEKSISISLLQLVRAGQ